MTNISKAGTFSLGDRTVKRLGYNEIIREAMGHSIRCTLSLSSGKLEPDATARSMRRIVAYNRLDPTSPMRTPSFI